MKVLNISVVILFATLLLPGCGIHTALVGNMAGHMTNVELARKNFKVVDKISGTYTATYIMGVGGLSHKALIEKAKADMFARNDLTGSSKAVVNVAVEEHIAAFLIFYVRRTVTVSAHVIEFTD